MFSKITRSIITFSLLLAVCLPALPVQAASASISLEGNKSIITNGGLLVVAVYMNGGGTPIQAVQADLSFPANKLQYIGFSSTGSAFEVGANISRSNGFVSIPRGTTSPVTGSALVGTVTFKALVGSGNATISVAASSTLVSDGNAVPYVAGAESVNFGTTAADAPAAPAPPKDVRAPVISAIKVKDVTPFGAVITWTTDEVSNSAVEYGVDTSYGLSASAAPGVTEHAIALNSPFLAPKTLIHYRVKSTDGAGNPTVSADQVLQLPGVPVTIVVRGADGKPQAGVTVTLDDQTGVTDSRGQVVLRSGLGNKRIVTTYQGVAVQKPITVENTDKPLPPIQLTLAKQPLNTWMLTSAGLAVVVLTLLALDALLFGSRFFAKFAGLRFRRPAVSQALGRTATKAPASAPPRHSAIATEAPARPAPAAEPVAKPPVEDRPEPMPEPEVPAAPELPEEPEIDINKTVAELMGEPAYDPDAPSQPVAKPKPISITHFGGPVVATAEPVKPVKIAEQPNAPIKINLEPIKPAAAPLAANPRPALPSAPEITPITVTDASETPAASVAKRLKKPAATAAKAAKPAAKKATGAKSKKTTKPKRAGPVSS